MSRERRGGGRARRRDRDPLEDSAELIRSVYAFLAHRTGQPADAEDLTSEVFERAVRYRSSYDPQRGEPIVWLIGIARRCLVGRSIGPPPTELTDEIPDGRDVEGSTLDRLSLRRLVAQLDERDQELIALRYAGDLSTRQIAAILETTPGAIDVRIHRALARLRALEAEESEAGRARAFQPGLSGR